ncbi:Acetyl-CoA carboxylase [Perkinsus chesapeaki]|uniref:Acetyl-CoA carboxylase n=1 Tax=Perkinsus chesapeaki TaxID=330153 RepID=A0A7J6MUB5_PERCH|nr:Acetyl-CoA carboxylase [Perkinsus chesapeaki]
MSLSTPAAAYLHRKGSAELRPLRILVANNGLSATKFIRSTAKAQLQPETCITRGVDLYVMETPDDREAGLAYRSEPNPLLPAGCGARVVPVEAPAGPGANNYGNVEVIRRLAIENECDMIWPGWGHASENPELPEAFQNTGIEFIGPSTECMRLLGDKAESTITAKKCGVPCIPWSGDYPDLATEGFVADAEAAAECCDRIGYPCMIKAAMGGGGKGIRMVSCREEVADKYDLVRGEIPTGGIMVMRCVTRARHFEVQILADKYNNVVALSTRDCSLQRRQQKMVEEGPVVHTSHERVLEMQKCAERLCAEVGYESAGTVEFLYDIETDNYYFLEVNTRLQVEHPVTELLSGVNLPSAMIQVSLGKSLYDIPDVAAFLADPDRYRFKDRHVMACRITAEAADDGFRPTAGVVERVKLYEDQISYEELNEDVFLYYFSIAADGKKKAAITQYSDSQFGHIFVVGSDRRDAVRRMVEVLRNVEVVGEIKCSVDYIREVMRTSEFENDTYHTNWLLSPTEGQKVITKAIAMDSVVNGSLVLAKVGVAAAICKFLYQSLRAESQFEAKLSAAQLPPHLATTMHEDVVLGKCGRLPYRPCKFLTQVSATGPDTFCVTLTMPNGEQIAIPYLHAEPVSGDIYEFRLSGWQFNPTGQRVVFAPHGETLTMYFGECKSESWDIVREVDPHEVRSQMAGSVHSLKVSDGDRVEAGSVICQVEAMKMFMPILMPFTGVIKFNVAPGSTLKVNDLIATLSDLEVDDPAKLEDRKPQVYSDDAVLHKRRMPVQFDPKEVKSVMRGYELIGMTPHEFVAQVAEYVLTEGEQLDGSYDTTAAQDILEMMVKIEDPADEMLAHLSHMNPGPSRLALSVAKAGLVDPNDMDLLMDIARSRRNTRLRVDIAMCVIAVLWEKSAWVEPLEKMRKWKTADMENLKLAAGALTLKANGITTTDTVAEPILTVIDEVPLCRVDNTGASPNDLSSLSSSEGNSSSEESVVAPQMARSPLKRMIRNDSVRSLFERALGRRTSEKVSTGLRLEVVKDLWPVAKDNIADPYTYYSQLNFNLQSATEMRWSDSVVGGARKMDNLFTAEVHLDETAGDYVKEVVAMYQRMRRELTMAGPSLGDRRTHLRIDVAPARLLKGTTDEACAEALRIGLNEGSQVVNKEAPVASVAVVLGPHRRFYFHNSAVVSEAKFDELVLYRNVPPHRWQELEWRRFQNYVVKPLPLGPCPNAYSPLSPQDVTDFASVVQATPREFNKGKWAEPILSAGAFVTSSGATSTPVKLIESAMIAALDCLMLNTKGPRRTKQQCNRMYLSVNCPEWDDGKDADEDDDEMGDNSAILGRSLSEAEKLVAAAVRGYSSVLWAYANDLEVRLSFGQHMPIRVFARGTPSQLDVTTTAYHEVRHPTTGVLQLRRLPNPDDGSLAEADGVDVDAPLQQPEGVTVRRHAAERLDTTYVYDFLELFEQAVREEWRRKKSGHQARIILSETKRFVKVEELRLKPGMEDPLRDKDPASMLDFIPNSPGTNNIGMVAWKLTMKMPEWPAGRDVYVVANDITFIQGSFAPLEDELFYYVSKLARLSGAPRIYIAGNSGARLGIAKEVYSKFKVAWRENSPSEVDYLYLDRKDYEAIPDSVRGEWVGDRFKITTIIGKENGIGVECLSASGLIAGETSLTYDQNMTMTYVTARTVGIGAYLARLSQRIIQKRTAPIILTGFKALNSVIGKEVYTSNDDIGGPHVMFTNGITQTTVDDDLSGVREMVKRIAMLREPQAPLGKLPHPAGPECIYDNKSFEEQMEGWAPSVRVGRATVGGSPVGIVMCATETTTAVRLADPADPNSSEKTITYEPGVLYANGVSKVAQTVSDLITEDLPLVMVLNCRKVDSSDVEMNHNVAHLIEELVRFEKAGKPLIVLPAKGCRLAPEVKTVIESASPSSYIFDNSYGTRDMWTCLSLTDSESYSWNELRGWLACFIGCEEEQFNGAVGSNDDIDVIKRELLGYIKEGYGNLVESVVQSQNKGNPLVAGPSNLALSRYISQSRRF